MRATRYNLLPYDSGHYAPADSLQWWYFDAEFPSGHRFMTITMPRMVGDVNDDRNGPVPGVTFVIKDPEGNNHHSHAYYPDEFQVDADTMRATFGPNSIEGSGGEYRLRFDQDGSGVDLTWKSQLPPWPPFPGKGGYMMKPLLWSLAPGKHMHYASFIPRGQVSGKLFLPEGEVSVTGEGYHEQGRTNGPIERLFTYWYWTRFFIDEWTFIFPVASAPRRALNATMRALLIYRNDQPIADMFDLTGLALNHRILERQDYEPAGRTDIPRRALFTAKWPGLRLRAEMDLFHLLEAFRFTPFSGSPPLQPAWLQHVMNVRVEMRVGASDYILEGEGVFETMLTGAV